MKTLAQTIVTLFVFGLLFGTPQNKYVYCQNTGCKYFKNYTREEYESSPQNWSILQDKRGIIYAANHAGVLEFDGISWRRIKIPHWSVRSMAVDTNGTIYVGGKNEIGFLAPDEKGALQYVSLLEYLEENKRNFSNVWKTYATNEGIYFSTSKFLFRWNPGQKRLEVWEAKNRFKFSFTCDGKFFIRQSNIGLMQMKGDSLESIPGGETFAGKPHLGGNQRRIGLVNTGFKQEKPG